ncbi:hypothetical protein A2U01_0108118, partial [Trifolium medium]|nr:hypothetical protein [Trifolium medium]
GRGRGKSRNNGRGRGYFQSQQHQWPQSPYQHTQFPYEQPLWTTPAYPRQQQWGVPSLNKLT